MRWFLGISVVLVAACFAGLLWMSKDSKHMAYYPEQSLEVLYPENILMPKAPPANYVVHFWASWCAPCLVELPKFKKFSEELKKDFPALPIYFVSTDQNKDDAKSILKRFNLADPSSPFLWVWDPHSLWATGLGTFQFPETYLVDLNSQNVKKWVGLQEWDGAAGLALRGLVSQETHR